MCPTQVDTDLEFVIGDTGSREDRFLETGVWVSNSDRTGRIMLSTGPRRNGSGNNLVNEIVTTQFGVTTDEGVFKPYSTLTRLANGTYTGAGSVLTLS